jgi:hypothetical protein
MVMYRVVNVNNYNPPSNVISFLLDIKTLVNMSLYMFRPLYGHHQKFIL